MRAQRVLERALLGGDLQRRRRVLQRAAAADAEVRAARRRRATALALERPHRRARARNVGLRLSVVDRHALAGQRAFDEDRLAVDARDAAAFLVERFDRRDDRRGSDAASRWRRQVRTWRTFAAIVTARGTRRTAPARSVEFGRCASSRSTRRPSGCAWPSATGTQWHRARRACRPGALGARAAAGPRRARRRRLGARRSRRHRVRRGPGLVHRRAHRAAASRRDWRSAPTCRVVAVPTLEALAQDARGARTAGRACSPASMRGCARSTSPPTRATATAGANRRRRAVLPPPRSTSRCRTRGDWFGAGNGFAAYPDARAAARARARRRDDARPTRASIGELALPRLAAGEGVGAARRAAALRAPSRRADHRRARRRARGSDGVCDGDAPRDMLLRRSRSGGRCAARDLAYVAALEAQIHAAPWTLGNFRDALAAGYCARVGEREGRIVAYGVLMLAPGEAQILNLSVVPDARRAGTRPRAPAPLRRRRDALGAEQMLPRSARVERRRDRAVRGRRLRAGRAPRRLLSRRHGRRAARGRARDAPRARRRGLHARASECRCRRDDEILRELGLASRLAPARPSGARGEARVGRDAQPRRCRRASRRAGADREARVARIADARLGRRSPPTSTRARPAGCAARASSTVPGVGDVRADWLFVGEAPGAEEDARGEPFVGQAGQAARQHARRARACARRATSTSPTCSSAGRPNNRTPEPREVDACRPYLDRQIALLAPEADRRARQERRDDAARHRRDDREPARARPPLPRRAAHRHLSSGLPAAQPARQGEGVGGSAARAAHARALHAAAERRRAPPRRRLTLAIGGARPTPYAARAVARRASPSWEEP